VILGILRFAQNDGKRLYKGKLQDKTNGTAKTTALRVGEQRGWVNAFIPPIAKCAMDGAPGLLWLKTLRGPLWLKTF
jgi:hypothetical protein